MRLVYLKTSLEVSRANGWGDTMAMWTVFGVPGIAEGSTRTLFTIRRIGKRY